MMPNDCLWINTDGTAQKSYKTIFNTTLKRAGLEHVELSPYCLRHTYCTRMIRAGVDSRIICKNVGTSMAMMERHYGQISVDKDGHLLEVEDVDLPMTMKKLTAITGDDFEVVIAEPTKRKSPFALPKLKRINITES